MKSPVSITFVFMEKTADILSKKFLHTIGGGNSIKTAFERFEEIRAFIRNRKKIISSVFPCCLFLELSSFFSSYLFFLLIK